MISKNEIKNYGYLLIFVPIFLTPNGLLKTEIIGNNIHVSDTGLVFPIYFFIGIIISLILFLSMFKRGEITYITPEVKIYILIIGFIGLLISSMGVIINADVRVYMKYIQILTGFIGVVISWYLFEYKQINIEKFFGKLGIVYFVIIILNFLYSFIKVGIDSFGAGLLPSIGVFGIYQTHVYYPFIVNVILFMSLPYMLKKYNNFLYIYLGFYILYLLSWQVRGAIISFIVMFIIAFIFKLKNSQKIKITIISLIFLFIIVYYFGLEILLGRFKDIENVKSFSGRTDIWISLFQDFDIQILFVGNLFLKGDISSAHNQYLEFLYMGGLLLLIPLLGILINLMLILYRVIKNKKLRHNNNLLYYILILLAQWIVDYNVNVPLSNTNPAIFYWFYINSIFVLYHFTVKSLNKDNNILT